MYLLVGIFRTILLFSAPSNSAVASKPVALNDKKVITEFTGNRNTEGYIGIQNHDADSQVSFRNVRIKEK